MVPFALMYISSVAHLSSVNKNITINLSVAFVVRVRVSFPPLIMFGHRV